jgi:hypothetical protein
MTMTEERTKILDMVASGKISVSEANDLLSAIGDNSRDNSPGDARTETEVKRPRYLRVLVEGNEHDYKTGETSPQKVNIRVPMQLLYAGVRLAGLIPAAAHGPINQALRENGIELDVSQIKTADLEELVTHLSDMQVDVDQKDQKVRIFCE